MRVVAQAGSYRGYGGLFVEPPLIVSAGDHFLARSDNECWSLTADVFGATFHRALLDDFEVASREQTEDGLHNVVARVGHLLCRALLPTLSLR